MEVFDYIWYKISTDSIAAMLAGFVLTSIALVLVKRFFGKSG